MLACQRKQYLAGFIFGLGLAVWGLALLSIDSNTRWLMARRLELTAQSLPPSSIMSRRLRAMATAIREGEKSYQFEMEQIPPFREERL